MIKSQITFKQLEAFVYVSDTGSFRKAATALGTTQPNISVRISAMETTLGTVLMNRDAGSVQLTERGALLLAEARTVIRAAETFLEVAGRKDLIAERLRLGVTELIAATWLHAFLRILKETYPAVRVELTVGLSQDIEKSLRAHELDLAIMITGDVPNGWIMQPVGNHAYGWFAAPALADALGKAPTMADLFAQVMITHGRNTRASQQLVALAAKQGFVDNQIVFCNSLTACLNMAIDGMGVTLLPLDLCAQAISEGRVVPQAQDWVPDPLRFQACYVQDRAPQFVAEAARLAVATAQDTA